ncbi:MAG TPA: nucleotide exchange factor GrpE [Chloroflexota bacterium]
MFVQRDQPHTPDTDGQPQGPPEPTPEAPEPTDELETLRAELAEIEQKADEYLRLAQRTQADFINYRRRIEEERLQQARDAGLSVLQRLFPILDDFDRAMSNASEAERDSGWGQGLLLVERNLRGLLAAEDVEQIEAKGAEFDPRLHEAVGSTPSAEVAEGHVLHVVRQGYRKGDRVLRPTQVIVASRPG